MDLSKLFGAFILSVLLIATLPACKKSPTPAPAIVTKFTDIKADASFDWSANMNINFIVTGLKNVTTETSTLRVMSVDGKNVYFTQFVQMSNDINTNFLVPRGTATLLVSFGSIQKTISVSGNSVSFNYTQDLTD